MSEVRFYLRLIMRRLPILLAIVILCSALGLIQALRMPAIYSANARLLVESPQISGELVTVEVAADEEIQIIRERLLTRANLLEIADEFNVFLDYSEMTPDRIVQEMSQATRINNRGGRNQATVITVSFEARSGQVAADVVNEYVTRITNASVELRTERAEGTLEFFEQEVDRLSSELDLRSAQISQFQAENADAMPAEQSFRLTRQAVLQESLASSQRELSSLIDQRARIVQIYEATGQIQSTDALLSDDERQLRDLERQLAQQLTIYSEAAPQIVQLRRRIEQLRSQIAASSSSDGEVNSSRAVLDLQLGQIDSQTAELESVIAAAEMELARLEDAIARTPLNTITLQSLERDYENIRLQYDRAVDRLAVASTGERIEVTSRGQRITLIESASVPREPASPNRKLIAFLGGVVGVGLAIGIFVLLELLNRTVRRPTEINRAFGIEPLATIPYISTRSERLFRFGLRAASLILVLVGLPALLWAVDTYYMPLDQLASRLLNRFGLA